MLDYRGSVGRTAPNLMRRDFHADAFLRKCGTDVTEFALPSGKCYFSPVVDFSNGEILSYSLSERPDMAMVMSMLAGLFARFPRVSGMMLHSDQGWPYQMECYRRALRDHGVVQSMSRKGNCLDNAETENLFSVMKKEMFYGHEKEFRSFAEFRDRLDEYVVWYNTERIKQSNYRGSLQKSIGQPFSLACIIIKISEFALGYYADLRKNV
jgi:putative transposase